MILWWFLLFGCPPPASILVGRYGSSCISDNIRRCTDAWDDLLLLIECMIIWMHANMSPIRYFEMFLFIFSTIEMQDHQVWMQWPSSLNANRICACPSGRSCLQVTLPSGLCFAGVLIHFCSGKFQALDMSFLAKVMPELSMIFGMTCARICRKYWVAWIF